MLRKNLVKSPAFPLPDRDLCWAQRPVRAAETSLVLFTAGYTDRAFLLATRSSHDLGPLLILRGIG